MTNPNEAKDVEVTAVMNETATDENPPSETTNNNSTTAQTLAWDTPLTLEERDDPLLACLIILTRIHHKPFSSHALITGLPLENNRLTPEVFVRAAARASLSANVVRRDLDKINALALPAVLLLQNKQACILLKLDAENAQIIQPESGAGKITISRQELAEVYVGTCIYVQQAYEFSERAEQTTHSTPKHWFWSVLSKSWSVYSEVLIASFLVNVFALAVPLFIRNIYDRVVPNFALDTMWVLASGIAIIFIFDVLLRTLRSYFIDIAGKNVDVKLSASIFEKVLGIRMAHRPNSVGAFTNTVQSFEFFREFITSSTITALVDVPFAFIFIIVIFILGGTLGFVPLLAMPIVFVVGLLLQKPLKRLSEETFKHAAEKYANLIETIGNAETVKTLGAEGSMQRRWEKLISQSAKTGIELRFFSNAGINFSYLMQQITSIVIVLFGVYKIMNNDITMGTLIACTILSGRALAPMSQVAAIFTRYHQAKTAMVSLEKVMALPVERTQEVSLLQRPKLQGNIDFRNVSFNYPNVETPLIDNFSLSIKAGEKVGIIGRIGSGKTTLAKLLLGLYQPTKGSILLDGIDQRQIDIADLRFQIGYVPQDITLFYGSIKDNISFGKSYVEDALILKAAAIAGVDKFVSNNPDGFLMQVGERGSRLSGGQRQSIAVARSLLLDPPLLVFDEPTNSMDDSTEAMFKKNLSEHLTGKTLVLITHKASMLSLIDRLIIMEGGAIVADGPRDAVIAALRDGKIKVQANKVAV